MVFLVEEDSKFFLKISEGKSAITPEGVQEFWSGSSKKNSCSSLTCSTTLLLILAEATSSDIIMRQFLLKTRANSASKKQPKVGISRGLVYIYESLCYICIT